MHKYADVTVENNVLSVSGDLNFFNVMSVYRKSLLLLKNEAVLHVDFSKLHSSDSAGLALVIEWIKLADKDHKKIQFSHLPQSLLTIAKASGLDKLIAASSAEPSK